MWTLTSLGVALTLAVAVGLLVRAPKRRPASFEEDFNHAVRTHGRDGRSPSKGVSH